ncbi:MAG: glycosyltransferase family 4 protein [Chloroflexi bacterium]|nr:glycosyltransferase family 4 protein [Chloroflexota bacterium]
MPFDPSQIRVGHVITRFHGAGGAKNTLMTCAGLVAAGYQVDLIVGASADRWRAEGSGVNWIQVPSLRRTLHPLHDLRAAGDLLRLFRERRYHIVHTHLAKAGILGRWAASRAGVPLIIHGLHGATFSPTQSWLTNTLYLLLERQAARGSDRIVSVGADLQQRYLAANVGRPEQYVLIHSGMDLRAFAAARSLSAQQRAAKRAELGLGADDVVVGYVAALEWRKGHHRLIQVAQQLCPRFPHLRFLFVGEGFDAGRLQDMVREVGLTDRILFSGYRTDVPEIMATLDVKVFASEREGLPQVLVQAAAVGLPVVAFEAEGVRELVRDGWNGTVLPQGDVNGMVAALGRLIQQPQLRQEMGARGPQLVDDRWHIATMQQKTLALYEALLTAKGFTDPS